MKSVFEPVQLNHLYLKNRLVRSATWEGIAKPDGSMAEEAYAIYEELAEGGVGAIITGFTSVLLHDNYFGGMMRLCDDALIPQYKKLTDIIHIRNCPVITQLALGAFYREVNRSWLQVEPDDMTASEIRARILLEILEGIHGAVPDLHVTVKINCSDFSFGGLSETECLAICRLLDGAGIDSIEVSGNGTSVSGIRAHVNEGYFVPAAARIAEEISCPVIVVGGFRSRETMENVLNKTTIALISLSRPLLCEPDLPAKMKENPSAVSKCVSCNACYSSPSHRCIFRRKPV